MRRNTLSKRNKRAAQSHTHETTPRRHQLPHVTDTSPTPDIVKSTTTPLATTTTTNRSRHYRDFNFTHILYTHTHTHTHARTHRTRPIPINTNSVLADRRQHEECSAARSTESRIAEWPRTLLGFRKINLPAAKRSPIRQPPCASDHNYGQTRRADTAQNYRGSLTAGHGPQ